MACLHPIYIKSQGRFVPCGKCPNCRQKMRLEMSTRLQMEMFIENKDGYMITLTYDDAHLHLNDHGLPVFSKDDCQKFIRSLRDQLRSRCNTDTRYFLTCELGEEFGRAHYHLILLIKKSCIDLHSLRFLVDLCWQKGRTKVDLANVNRINYATAYALKEESYQYRSYEKGDPAKPFRLFSLRPGIAGTPKCLAWFEDYANNGDELRTTLSIGRDTVCIPRYNSRKYHEDMLARVKVIKERWLNDAQADMYVQKVKHSQVDPITGDLSNDYTEDRKIIAHRQSVRRLKKQNLKNDLL